MKTSVVILLFLTQTSASFFSELTNSISLVQSGIGKLFNDATVDFKDTIDCSVYAVQQAFSDDGIVQGYQKCQEMNNNNIQMAPTEPVNIIITQLAPSTEEPITMKPINKQEKVLTSKVTESNTKNNEEIDKKSVESYLVGLVNMSSKLEREFEDLSKHVNDDLVKIENEQKEKPTMEKMMKEIDKLKRKEAKKKVKEVVDRNKTDSEIHEFSDKILTKLEKNNNDYVDLKDEFQAELEEDKNSSNLEQEFKVWKDKESEDLDDLKDVLRNKDIKAGNSKSKHPVLTRSTTASPIRTNTPVLHTSTLAARRTTYPIDSLIETDDFVNKDKSTIDQALKLVRNSRKTASIMAKILKHEKSASSVFDRPDLFGR